MTKRNTTMGELISLPMLDSFLQDLKDEPLYGKVVTKTANYDMASDTDTFLILADGTGATVQVTLPAATGTGRIIAMVATNVENAVTMVRTGSAVLNASGTTLTFTPAWEYAVVMDADSDQWVILSTDAALT